MLCACLGSNNYKEQRANMLKNPAGRASSEMQPSVRPWSTLGSTGSKIGYCWALGGATSNFATGQSKPTKR